jgi:hypothetical protein
MGWVYCLVTPSMPGVVKIGATERDPTEHLPDYAIAWAVEVTEPFDAERRIHVALSPRRVDSRREFFCATADEARALITLDITVGAAFVESAQTEAELSYEAKKALFEQARFKTTNGKLKFHRIDVKTGDVISESKDAFTLTHEDWLPVGGKSFLDRWYADGHKRSYDEIEYSCVKDEDKLSSVYYAFPKARHTTLTSTSTEEERKANVGHLLDYLRLLVEDNPAHVKWMTLWLADILVNPHSKGKQPIAVILWGEQGAGKTHLRELMARLLGERLVHHTDDPLKNGDILHDFNATLKFKLFIEFEELNMKTHSQVADRIKALITGHTHTITHKGHDSIDVRASERALFTTNSAGSAVIERGDRRYAAFAVSPRRVGDTAYWNGQCRRLDDASYIKDVAEYLLSLKDELAHYALRDNRPRTDYYSSLQHLSISPELDFLRDVFLYGGDEFAGFLTRDALYSIPSSQLAARYNTWRVSNGLRDTITSKSFTMKMTAHGTGYGIQHEKTTRCNNFVIDAPRLCAAIRRDFNIDSV